MTAIKERIWEPIISCIVTVVFFNLYTKSKIKIQWKEIFSNCYKTDYRRLNWIEFFRELLYLPCSKYIWKEVLCLQQCSDLPLPDNQNRKPIELKRQRLLVILNCLSFCLTSKNIKTMCFMLCSKVSQSFRDKGPRSTSS